MEFIDFTDLQYTYPPLPGDVDENNNQIEPQPVFDHFTAYLPGGFVSLVGPNGSGKSTLMLLASGRLLPQQGSASLFGCDTRLLNEESREALASFVYQNMELETDENVGELLHYVFENGSLKGKKDAVRTSIPKEFRYPADYKAGKRKPYPKDLLGEVKIVFELEQLTGKKLDRLSKGELQRVLSAFSLLYGSKSIFMDEPFFAMEEYQKENALAYLRDFYDKTKRPIYISMHELDLTRKYAEQVLFFYPNRDMSFGTPEEVLNREDLERAYNVPESMLRQGESLSRKLMLDEHKLMKRK